MSLAVQGSSDASNKKRKVTAATADKWILENDKTLDGWTMNGQILKLAS